MSAITYCANGCTRRHGDEWHPVQTTAPSQLCDRCEERLHDWLTQIPEKHALLPTFIEHGTTDPDPDGRASKNPSPPAPLRLDVLDQLDGRHGRMWQGLAPAHDRRGPRGILRVYVERLAEERNLTTINLDPDIPEACATLDRHRLWLAEQDWIDELYDQIRRVHRNLSDAIGDYRRPSVGVCPNILDSDDGDEASECGGPIYGNHDGTAAYCSRCHRRWAGEELSWLGTLQSTKEPDAATAHELALWYAIPTATIRKWAERGKVTKHGKNDRGHQTYDVAEVRMMQKSETVRLGA